MERPDDSNDNFYDKLERQIEAASPEARRLTAEMLWILLLFQTRMRPETKRDNIARVWSWSGEELDRSHPLLSDDCLLGVGHPGQGYNNWRWKELAYLITVAKAFKEGKQLRLFLKGRASPSTLVRDIMETQVLYARPDQTADECMAVMSARESESESSRSAI